MTDALNTTFGDEYIFGGINTSQAPLTNYFAQPTAGNRQAVINAFQAEFGFAPDDPAVASIIPSQMQSFIDMTVDGDLRGAGLVGGMVERIGSEYRKPHFRLRGDRDVGERQ